VAVAAAEDAAADAADREPLPPSFCSFDSHPPEAVAAWVVPHKNPVPPYNHESSLPVPDDAYDQSYSDILVKNVHDSMSYDRLPPDAYV
jgi:hypothetical protein